MFALASSTVTSVMFSLLFNEGRIGVRDLIYGSIAGAISSAAASAYITNPVYGILFGFISAALQVIIMNTVEKNFARNKGILNTYSFTLFGGQGLLGCVFASAWQAVNLGYANGFTYAMADESVFGFVDGLIAMCMGVAFGALTGLFVMLVSSH